MPKVATGYPTTTSDSFNCLVEGITAGEEYRWWLYYDYGEDDHRPIVNDARWTATGSGGHTFSQVGLVASRDLLYTIEYLPVGKTDWITDGKYVVQGGTARTKDPEPEKVWPGNWTKWKNLKAGDACTLVTASDWNDFLDHINDVIEYKGGTRKSFTKVSKGDEMKADYFNNGAATAMRGIGLSPPTASKGSTITAQFFIDYEDALNDAKE